MFSCLSFSCNTIPLYNNQSSSSSQGSATLSIRSRHKRFATILEICPNRPIKAHLCLRRQDAPLDLACCRQLPLTYRGLGCKRSDYLSPARPHDKYLASSLISRLSAVASLIALKLLATSLPPVGLTHIRPFCFFCHVMLNYYNILSQSVSIIQAYVSAQAVSNTITSASASPMLSTVNLSPIKTPSMNAPSPSDSSAFSRPSSLILAFPPFSIGK